MGLLNAYNTPDPIVWNKLTSQIDHAEFVNAFFNDGLTNDKIYLSHDSDLSSTNRSILDYCMFSEIKRTNAKAYLKLGAFQTIVNRKYCTSKHQLGKILNNGILRTWFKQLNLITKDFCKIINNKVDPNVL